MVYVQPESQAPAPWIRDVEFLVGGRMVRTRVSAFRNLARDSVIVLVHDSPEQGTIDATEEGRQDG